MTRAALLALGGLMFGCAPSVSVGFESPDPQGRVIALAKAAENPAEGDIPSLIGALDSADSAQRLLAINALERLTGETMGYRHFDAPWRRARAVERWTAWWEQRQGGGEAISASVGGPR